ncbi:sec-independent protein translocase protein TatB [Williamsia limnetica]|uniref:Sec-independent protein translocase protein TatB n=1 Tax=Williamsia limnetica TaxID=882452 RepID=A0A318REP3_WILLI|nr:Sec-independent protein translocase protein TatB [Williamsia limnetica]PYE12588.1 sec-independent protein translocase protein TatB [Williamsia limnetica]
MFSSVGWGEIAVLMIAGLVILGPERLPSAISWTMKSIRQVRDYATGATSALKDDLGADFEDLRKPLAELNELRGMSPRSVITKHLLDGDDSIFTGKFDGESKIKPVSQPLPTTDENSTVVSLGKGTGTDEAAGIAANTAPGKTTGPQSTPNLSKATDPDTTSGSTETAAPAAGSVDRWDAT